MMTLFLPVGDSNFAGLGPEAKVETGLSLGKILRFWSWS